jgi:signal transduction histidine kinase
MVTRYKGQKEIVVKIDWNEFINADYLDEVRIHVRERTPKIFTGRKTGTRIDIRKLKGIWTRGKLRNLHRSINSICSPFESPSDFKAELSVKPDYGYFEALMDVEDVLESAPFRASGIITNGKMHYEYQFLPSRGMKRVRRRRVEETVDIMLIDEAEGRNLDELGIGPIKIDLRIFDRTPSIMKLITSDVKGLRAFLNMNGGIRVYRDGIRVYDYGEPGNDWLNLGGRRVNVPAGRISNNIVIGSVSLKSGRSSSLVEKTNREGFMETVDYDVFRQAVLAAITHIEAERNKDKIRLRKEFDKATSDIVIRSIESIRKELREHNLEEEIGPLIDDLETSYRETLDFLLVSSGAGIGLFVLVHELDRLLGELRKALKRKVDRKSLRNIANELHSILGGVRFLAQRRKVSSERVSELIDRSLSIYDHRFRSHGIDVINGIKEMGNPDFSVKCNHAQIILVLTNLIDNAIYWLDVKGQKRKKIYIGTSVDLDGPSIVVADNGTGLMDSPDALVQAFFTRKRNGTGLGLYIADEIMKRHNGRLVFPTRGDVGLKKQFSGAIVALVFEGDE